MEREMSDLTQATLFGLYETISDRAAWNRWNRLVDESVAHTRATMTREAGYSFYHEKFMEEVSEF